jgi:arylsulfatase A-like enzyme
MNQPNILFIVSHDLGRHLNCYGQSTVHSPNLDRLAAGGAKLDNCFCSAPQCSPSRASMMTGRYPHSNGVMGLTHSLSAWDLHDAEVTLPMALRDAGYHTVLSNGQHFTRKPPASVGFNEHLRVNGMGQTGVEKARQTAQWLGEHADDDQPFFLHLAFFEPHRGIPRDESRREPLRHHFVHGPDREYGVDVPPFLCDTEEARQEFAEYQGDIRHLDDAMGVVLDALDETGLTDTTLVVFCADHGMPFPRAKCSVYDPGLEVATMVRWPGHIAPDTVVPQLVSNVDYLPTLCDMLELPVPDGVQGQSFAHLLRGEEGPRRDAVFGEQTYHSYCSPMRCIRTAQHKLIVNFTFMPAFMDPSQSWRRATVPCVPEKPHMAHSKVVELYDLQNDPYEQQNLAEDAAYEDVRRQLLGRLRLWLLETDDPILHGIPVPPMQRMAWHALGTGDVVHTPEELGDA